MQSRSKKSSADVNIVQARPNKEVKCKSNQRQPPPQHQKRLSSKEKKTFGQISLRSRIRQILFTPERLSLIVAFSSTGLSPLPLIGKFLSGKQSGRVCEPVPVGVALLGRV
ncbi:lysine histidine transporter-like 5-like protein [Corchorus olitorius]|uniref:Lysine histidine transporter-like 5-like protein n=1 Tax=Corchorus olitorius TaxID=93759 RepID=A0A1R3H4E3_9ROSI|nr:lysine histidine transporter-like 5-like protein [Corchorus olitorius]